MCSSCGRKNVHAICKLALGRTNEEVQQNGAGCVQSRVQLSESVVCSHADPVYFCHSVHICNSSKKKQPNSPKMCHEICKSCERGCNSSKKKNKSMNIETGASERTCGGVCCGK